MECSNLTSRGSTVIDEEIDTHQIDLVESVSEVDSSKNKDFENSSKVDKVEEASKRLISVFESEDSEDDFESKKEQEVLKSESEDEKQDDMLQDEVSDAEVEESIRESERKRLIKIHKKRRKSRSVEDSGEEEPTENHNKKPTIFEQSLAELKGKSKGRKKNYDSDDTSLDDMARDLLRQMDEAAELDRQANSSGQPALEKLKLLSEVQKWIKKKDGYQFLIENGFFISLKNWLMPLPDKSLPSLVIRNAIFDSLSLLEMTETFIDHLKESGLGKMVMFYSKHPKENEKTRMALKKMIQEWLRPVFKIKSSFKELSSDERLDYKSQEKQQAIHPKAEVHKYKKKQEEVKRPKFGEPGFVKRALVPKPSLKDYYNSPKSVDESSLKIYKCDPRTKKFRSLAIRKK
ncbi:protein IWS1 homolog [Zophobas morio]|uniref:protein IWS1 homolog n=1 Tax=Zophobas morio TaxID=2755281 RepID=UPI003083AB07